MARLSIPPLLYLSDDDVGRLALTPASLRTALRDAFRHHGEGRALVDPKRTLPVAPGRFFQSMSAVLPESGVGGTKWVGVSAENAQVGLPTVSSLVVLGDAATGLPVAAMSANRLTVLRTAAMSALAAEYLARPDSASIGFIGCGEQARGHLPALLSVLPDLRSAVCVSGGAASAERLAETARDAGLDARAARDPGEALACDVVVTSVRLAPGLAFFLDASRVRAGAFVAAVDAGASWRSDSIAAFDVLATDDRVQAEEPSTRARLAAPRPFDADLAELVCGRAPGRGSPEERALFLFPGFALADLAVGALILGEARAAGVGLALPR